MNKALFFAVFVLLFCCAINGQINTREEPISFRSSVPILAKSEKTMKSFVSLDMKKIELEDMEDEKNMIPPRFGYPHTVNYNLDNSGEWVKLPNGDKIWRLVISCQDAVSINLLYDKFWLPDGAKLFVYGNDRKHTIGAITSANNKGDKNDIQGFATGLVFGDQITLEYYLPKDVKETGIVSVAYVVHGYRYVHKVEDGLGYGGSGNCQVNINCQEGQSWQSEKNAVAMILVNGIRNCSGSLINTTSNDTKPLFLTANHCLTNNADAISAPSLNYWSFYWHYESPGCSSTSDPPYISTSGAIVVANSSASDFALLRLTENPRYANGVTPYYLGWDRSGNTGTGGVGIHHPRGDVKKIATHNKTPLSSGSFWKLYWMQTTNGYSVTEGGSSGSPLINNSRRVIGQLQGGSNINCSSPANDLGEYGKFSVSWTGNGNSDSRRRLKDWLDPNNTGVSVLDGCGDVFNLANQTVTGNTTVTNNCGDINVQNTAITSTGSLTVKAANKITITSPFNAQAGSTLLLKVP